MSIDWESLKFRPMSRLTSSKYNALVDAVKSVSMDASSRVKYDDLSNLAYNIIPDQDNTRDIGSSGKQWRNVYAVNGYFSGNLLVQGKQVIKDGDPVGIGDISDTARDKIIYAINNGLFNQKLDQILSTVSEIGSLALLDSRTTPLQANAQWISTVDDSPSTGRLTGYVYSDVSGTLYVEQSGDGSNWDVVDTFSVTGGQAVRFSVEKICRYARVRYVNGSSAQNVFRLYVYRRLRVV